MHTLKLFSMSRCLGEAWRLLAHVADHLPNYWRMFLAYNKAKVQEREKFQPEKSVIFLEY